MVDASTQDRRGADDPAGVRGQAREPDLRTSASVVGISGAPAGGLAARSSSARNALPSERSASASSSRGSRRGRGSTRRGRRDRPVEPPEVEALDPAGALELGQHPEERMSRRTARRFGRSRRRGSDCRGGPDQVLEEGAGRCIRPVEVLDGEDERAAPWRARQQGPHRLVQPPGPAGLVVRRPLRAVERSGNSRARACRCGPARARTRSRPMGRRRGVAGRRPVARMAARRRAGCTHPRGRSPRPRRSGESPRPGAVTSRRLPRP